MNTKIKSIVIGVMMGGATAVALAAGTEATEAVADNASGIVETLEAIATFLPWPWNVVAGGVLTIGGALFAWRKKKTSKPKNEGI